MKLRVDLLAHLTFKDVLNEALHHQHQYEAESVFAKTGAGKLKPLSPTERAEDQKRGASLAAKLKRRNAKKEKRERKF